MLNFNGTWLLKLGLPNHLNRHVHQAEAIRAGINKMPEGQNGINSG
jgi:hypothetical protein